MKRSLIQRCSAINPLPPHQGCHCITYLKQHSSHLLPTTALLQDYSFQELCCFLTYKRTNICEATRCMLSENWVISNQPPGFKEVTLEPQKMPQSRTFAQAHISPQRDRTHGWKQLARSELECWWGYFVHSNPAQTIIETTVQAHPHFNGCCKGFRTNRWAPKSDNSFWSWFFCFSSCPNTWAQPCWDCPEQWRFPHQSWKVSKNSSARLELLGGIFI